MSEKEQSEALRLLAKLVATFGARPMSPEEADAIREAQAFLRLPLVATDVEVGPEGPESHGTRRS